MSREIKVYFEDILAALIKIERYTAGLSKSAFFEDQKTMDAVVRNLEIIGEAVKTLPNDVKRQYPKIEWKKIAGLRDILIHEYFGIDQEIIWDIIKNKLISFKEEIENLAGDK
ncbi:MAG TPA: DUF86 domain-containing protein [Bdellovibrionota bacterium]|nr:DUF86 domain-containing protein [Bdellovibrionota bacterium]